jgi:potassium/hydrogen antiporter
MDVITILLAVSFILFFGAFAEFIFKKLDVPDVLFLIILGFVLGPHALKFADPAALTELAPIFTTFTLLFLLFDGAFNINLNSLLREFSHSLALTSFNFFISTLLVAAVMWISGFSILISLLTGFLLGGVSSSFVIPVLNQMNIKPKLYSLLTLESALTDVFCIVFSLTVLEIMNLGTYGFRDSLVQLISLFAIAGLIGLAAGVFWIFLTIKVFKENKHYMITIAYVILIYVITEFLNGNGAIATLVFGLMLNNSKQLSSILKGITSNKAKERKKALKGDLGVNVTTQGEQYFYHQISFLLKTFFFVYIGILIDLTDMRALIIGGIISVLLLVARPASRLLTKRMETTERTLVDSIFARGLAAAAIAQLALQAGVPHADFIVKVAFVAITGTILLSSIRVFIFKIRLPKDLKVKPTKK